MATAARGLVAAGAMLALAAGPGQAELLVYEGFDYAINTPVDGKNGGQGWNNAWSIGANSIGAEVRGNASLPYAGLMTSGRYAFATRPAGENRNTDNLRRTDPTLGTDDTTRYFSFVLSPIQVDSGFGGVFLNGPGFVNLYIGKTSAGKKYGLSGNVSGDAFGNPSFSDVDASSTVATLLVVKAEFKNGNDTFSLFVNPTPGGAEPGAASATKNDLNFTAGRFDIEILANREWGFDELRIGTTWADVTPKAVPEPATLAAAGVGLLALVLRARRR